MRPPTLLPHLTEHVSVSVAETSIMNPGTAFAAYVSHPSAAQNCDGLGPCIVLPVATGQPFDGALIATSMCNGTHGFGEWWWNNRIIQITSPSTITYASWLYVVENHLIYAANTSATAPMLVPGVLFTPPKPKPREISAQVRTGRRALRRSINLYSRFRGLEELRRFIRGDTIVYEGEQYNYRIRKTVKVLQHTMNPNATLHPYTFFAADKKTDKELSRGCISISGIPVIDQLLALSFYIQDPKDEHDLIKEVNWSPNLIRKPRAPRARPVMQEAA